MELLALGGTLVVLAALLAGIAGFGFGIIAVPLLLLAGFPLPFVVTVGLLVSLVTRVSVVWRLWRSIHRRRVAALIGAALPGLCLGTVLLRSGSVDALRFTAGVAVALATAALGLAGRFPPNPRIRGMNLAAGFTGGVLGTSTSLSGVPPALLLTRRGVSAKPFLADLAAYFVATSAIGLGVLVLSGHFSHEGAKAFLWWLPGVLAANVIGTSIALRLPAKTFRSAILLLSFAAGVTTAATAF